MNKITESAIEKFTIELLEKQGYEYIYGPTIAPDSDLPERQSFEDVILLERVKKAMDRINPTIPSDALEDALKQIQRLSSSELISNNETFHRMLTEGIKVNYQKDGNSRGDLVWLIDFNEPENNDFVVLNQYTVIDSRHLSHSSNSNKRPDVILFINGLPLVVIELKNPVDQNATISSAFKQLETYRAMIPSLFTYNALLIISDGLEAKAGSISSAFSRFMAWKTMDGKQEASHLIGQLEILIKGMLGKETLLDLIRHFIVFETSRKEDKAGITIIETVKKIAAYHQYYAVNRAVESTLRASGFITKSQKLNDSLTVHSPEMHGLKSSQTQKIGDKKGGVIWHTQGSGKSLSMVFYTGKVVLAMDNPTVLIITDRNDLDDQLFDTFASAKQLLRQEPKQVDNREQLKELLRVASGGVIFTTIQKFQPEEGNVYETLSERKNIIVIADEAHRTQYGFKAKTIDDKDEKGNIIGKKIVYGFAKYMRDALPNATYLGFTGTPIENTDVNTPAVFGNYVDIYDIAQSIHDGATVKIFYESRLAKISLTEEGKRLVQELEEDFVEEVADDSAVGDVRNGLKPFPATTTDDRIPNEGEQRLSQKAKAKWTQLEALIGSPNRIKQVAKDLITHFEQRQGVIEGKAMIVSMSRRIAAELYQEIILLKPEWHNEDLAKGKIKVVMTSASSDGPTIAKHHTTKDERRKLAERMKNSDDELKLVIVRDMWLTGFDVPSLHTLYIDKPMKGHNLMQAIARVNRVYKDKTGGLIVDYLGIASDLKKALSFYADSGGKGDPLVEQEQAVNIMLEKLEVVSQMFNGFAYEEYFTANTGRKLSLILAAEEHILGIENGKKRFIDEVTALSKAFSIAIPHDKAMDAKDEVAFFQAIKARLVKFENTGSGRTSEEMESAIRQVIDKALVTDKVIDVFDAAGIKKPDISILSDEFLMEVKNMEHKNLALEVLKKLLNDEINSRTKKNLIQSRTLVEMLEASIKKYHNKILTAAEVIEELIKLSKEIQSMDKEPKEMGLSDYEYAFYTAIANNDSAREVMEKDKLRELAVILFQKVKENASIDWTIKESVKAKLKVIVKRVLRQFGYPPDMQMLATETVLKQAELIAEELLNG